MQLSLRGEQLTGSELPKCGAHRPRARKLILDQKFQTSALLTSGARYPFVVGVGYSGLLRMFSCIPENISRGYKCPLAGRGMGREQPHLGAGGEGNHWLRCYTFLQWGCFYFPSFMVPFSIHCKYHWFFISGGDLKLPF